MSSREPLIITISYDAERQQGIFSLAEPTTNAIWERFRQLATTLTDHYSFQPMSIVVPWPTTLSLIREFSRSQRKRNFRLKPDARAEKPIQEFLAQLKSVRLARSAPPTTTLPDDLTGKLIELGFTKRKLKCFQMRDLQHLLSLYNGANFSVPGAGKTTVTFALHLLTHQKRRHLLVVCPKSSFLAWSEIVQECIDDSASRWVSEPFVILTGGADAIRRTLDSGHSRFIINYEQLATVSNIFTSYLMQHPVHLVLDESHRMKGGFGVQKGVVLLNAAALPVRRDILTGTPMPQSASDLQSQIDFLWPGSDLGLQISRGIPPREVIGNLYVRTTKKDMDLPAVKRHFIQVGMGKGQSVLYAVVRNETLRELSTLRSGSGLDIVRARRSVMRLLQLSINPVLALRSVMDGAPPLESGIVQQVLDDGPSPKMIAVRELARKLAAEGRKSVIWTIFTDTIEQMERMLADLNPVSVYGAVPSGDPSSLLTREGRIKHFNSDSTCMTFIANPATAGEGINLHNVCHDAIYLDRSYNSTHYLQSIDRIHRLGLPSGIITNIHIFQTTAPKGLGCIDHSVSRRLATKLRALERLLDDEDLHRISFDEENADEPIDYDIEAADLVDLIETLESKSTFCDNERC